MKKLLALTAAAVAACAPTTPVELTAREQGELNEALRGRVAGTPVNCVQTRDLLGNRSVGEGVILFEGRGGVVYVNRPAAGCPKIDSGRALVTRTTSTQLCRGDIATVVDPVAGFTYGGCGLGDFVPYRRTN
ncbi:MAG TPA: hypothetical protein VGD10_08510 [Allosphingosinicella sp.]|uniref:hypothetical protein n=1 Tax=Allosphingosinicella sp. TaxID=2823234 RepID=UPI002ED9B1C6